MPDERNRLIALIKDLEDQLKEVVGYLGRLAPHRGEEARVRAMESLEDLMANHFPRTLEGIKGVSDRQLQDAGLWNRQLEFKLQECTYRRNTLRDRLEAWRDVLSQSRPGVEGRAAGWPLRRLKLAFANYVDAVDTVVDSIATLVGPAHAIKEFKDTLRGMVKDK